MRSSEAVLRALPGVAWLVTLGAGCGGQVESAIQAGPIDGGHADVGATRPSSDAADAVPSQPPSADARQPGAMSDAAADVVASGDSAPAKDAGPEDAVRAATCGCAAGDWHIDLQVLGPNATIAEEFALIEAYPLDIHCLEDAPLLIDNCFGAQRLSGCAADAEPCLYLAMNDNGFLLGHLFTGGVYLPMADGVLTAGPITDGGRSGTFSARVVADTGTVELRGSFLVCAPPPLAECPP